jgi:hypothetical protein
MTPDRRAVCLVVLVLWALVPSTVSSGTRSDMCSPRAEESSIGVQSTLCFIGRTPNQNDYAVMDRVAESGAGWVRYWLNWYQVEVDSGLYRFEAADSVINGYTSRGVNVYLTLYSGNQWYDGPDSSCVYEGVAYPEQGLAPTPGSASLQGWLRFVEAAVTRYRDTVQHWDIWNEPNLDQFWQPAADPQQYAYLLRETAQTIRSVDPTAVIIGLGTSTIDFPYVSAVLQEGVIDCLDYLGFHPYRLYPEDDQDNLGLPYPPSPCEGYEEEVQALLDTLRAHDPSGRVGLWDEEAGYPSRPETFIWTEEALHSTETTQAKYLLRRFLLNLALGVRVTTWYCDYDPVSAYPSILGPTWYQHYYDADFSDKEVAFPFSFLGLTYSPPMDTLTIEAEHYDSLCAPMKEGDGYIYTEDGDGDLQGSAHYGFSICSPGLYSVWLRLRNPDETAAFVTSVDDSTELWVTNALPGGTGEQFIWSIAMDVELIRWHYVGRGPRYFFLAEGNHGLTVRNGTDGSSLDKIVIKNEGPDLTLKAAHAALGNLATFLDRRFAPGGDVGFTVDNLDVPASEWGELRAFAFRDTAGRNTVLAYWLGLEIESDNHEERHLMLTIEAEPPVGPVLIDMLDGQIEALAEFSTTDSSVTFPSLPVTDSPYCVALRPPLGAVDTLSRPGVLALRTSPNPVRDCASFSYILPRDGRVLLRILDVRGREVATLVNRRQTQGSHDVVWDATAETGEPVAPGVFVCRLECDDTSAAERVVIAR